MLRAASPDRPVMTMNPLAAMLPPLPCTHSRSRSSSRSAVGPRPRADRTHPRVLPQATVAVRPCACRIWQRSREPAWTSPRSRSVLRTEAGTTRRISGQSVPARLQESGLSDAVAADPRHRGHRAHQTVDENALRPAIEAQLANRLSHPGDHVDEIDVQRQVRIPLGAYDVEGGSAVPRRRPVAASAAPRCASAGRNVTANVPVRVKIATFGNVVVARQPIARGTILRRTTCASRGGVDRRRRSSRTSSRRSDTRRASLAAGKP